jgi:hypothetical protein
VATLRRVIVALIVAAVALWLGSLWGADTAPAGDGSVRPPPVASGSPA